MAGVHILVHLFCDGFALDFFFRNGEFVFFKLFSVLIFLVDFDLRFKLVRVAELREEIQFY